MNTLQTPAPVVTFDQMNRNDLVNEISYLREALCTTIQALQNMKDNLESGRVQITILDDGEPHPGNMDAGIAALTYAKICLQDTRHI